MFLYGRAAAATAPTLGTSQSFAVLGASTVTNTGPTVITGNLGVSPGTAVTGFPPGVVIGGIIHANDAVALQAQNDVTTAYNALAGQACNTNLTGQDLGGLTLIPGVYCFDTSAQLTGTLVLDAQGDPNAVFVFQMGSTLTTASSSTVRVINAGQLCNVFWQVGSSATLGTATTFVGNILALASITLNTGANLSGRALARSGAVTLDTNAVSAPFCSLPALPAIGKSFSPVSITPGGVSTLTLTLSNPNSNPALLTAPFIDTLPTGVVIAATPNAANTCGGAVSAVAGGNKVTLTGGAVPGGSPGTCTVTVNVTAAVAGVYLNTVPTGALQTVNGNNPAPAIATLTVVPPVGVPTLAKAFSPASINAGGVSTLTITLINPNAGAATLSAPLVDTLPAGVVIAATPNAANSCGGVVTAVAGTGTVTLTGGAIPGGAPGTCTVTVNVTAAVGGSYLNTLPAGALQTSNGNNPAPIIATLTVVPPPPVSPTLAKAFSPGTINASGGSTLTITLSNPNANAATLTAALVDILPAGVVISATPNAANTCGGVVTAVAGGNTVTLTGGAIPGGAPGSCTVTVSVTAATGGNYINTLPASALQTVNGINVGPAIATLTVVPPVGSPTIGKAFTPASINAGGVSTLTITLINPNAGPATLSAPLTDTLPAGVVIAPTPNASNTCGGAVTAVAGAGTVTLTGGAIPGGSPGTCTVTVDVSGAVGGSYINVINAGALQTSNGNNAGPAIATLSIVPLTPPVPPTLFKAFSPPGISVAGTSTLTITLSNPNLTIANLTAPLVDTLPAGVVIAPVPNAATTCPGSGVVVASAGGSTVTLPVTRSIPAGNGTIAGNCTVTVNVTAALPGSYINILPIGALQTSNGFNLGPALATLIILCPPIDTTITAPATVCEVSTGNLASVPNAGVGATYLWTITNGTVTTGQGTPNITFMAGTTSPLTLNVTVTTLPGCSASASRQVIINPLPVTTIIAPTAACELSTGNTASVPNAGVGATYLWTITNGSITAGQGTPNITWTAGATGPVTLNVTVTTGAGCSANGSAQVALNPNPTAAAGPPQTLCQTIPGPTVFTLTGTVGNGTPLWSIFSSTGTAVAMIVSPNSATTVVNVTGVGTVTLRLTSSSANCAAATSDVVLTVLPLPIANAGMDQSLCQTIPGPTVFTVIGNLMNGTPATPAWTVVGTTGTAVPTILTPNNITTGVNVAGAGTVTLRFTVNSNSTPACGTVTDDVVLTVTTSPVVTITAATDVCVLSTGNLASVPNAGVGATYLWTITNGTITAGQGTPNITWTAGATGPVTLNVAVQGVGCGPVNGSAQVALNPNPTAAAGPPQTLCQLASGPTVFTVNGTVGNGTPLWSIVSATGTAVPMIVTPNNATTNVNVTGNGTVTLRLTVTSNTIPACGVATSDIVLTINALPVATITAATDVCVLSTGNLASVPNAGVGATYIWTITNGTITAGQGTPNITWTAGATGPVMLNVAVQNVGCNPVNGSAQVALNPNPTAAAGPPQTLCQLASGPTVFTVNGTVGSGTPLWSVVGSTGTAVPMIVTPNNATTNVNVTGNGTVTLRLTVTSNTIPACGTATSDVVLTINALPIATITALTSICELSTGNTASVPDAGPGATYNWTVTNGTINTGQGTRTITYTAGAISPVTINVTVTTAAGCSANSSANVTLNNLCAVDLSISKTGSAPFAYETGLFTYLLTVVNHGPGTATGVMVNDPLPSGLTLVSATPTQGTCSGTTTINCSLGTLAAQVTATITLVVRLPMKSAGTIIRNAAIVTSIETDSVPIDNTSTVETTVEKIPAGPGPNLPPTSEISDQKAGSVLVFPYYTSDASLPARTNTRISITNVENQWTACIHLFFVDGTTCSVADLTMCLTPNQTISFLMSDLDPGTSGYLLAVQVDCMTGCPLRINALIGEEYVKLASGHAANLGAEAISGLPGASDCNGNSLSSELRFDGLMYNRLPQVLALDSLASPVEGNNSQLVLSSIGGDMRTGGALLGTLFGILYNDTEIAYSFSFTAGCQFSSSLTDAFPRTSPRFSAIIPEGRTGWLRLWAPPGVGMFGATLNFNPHVGSSSGAFNQGHNLHKMTLAPSVTLTIPIFPPSC
jgi:uncharacterized repeat protein (TIGR01451 family)